MVRHTQSPSDKVTPGSQQRTAKLNLPCPKFFLHLQMRFVNGRDGPFCRHLGRHFRKIDCLDSGAIHNSIHALVAPFI
jgi:hypothetical protein